MTAAAAKAGGSPPDKLSLVVFSGDFERVHYALVLAAGAVASNKPVTLFFTMGAARALMKDQGWHRLPSAEAACAAEMDRLFAQRGIGTFEELLQACQALGAVFMVCEMGLKALGLDAADLRSDITIKPGGVVTFLADASKDGGMMFI
jgi:peroxiredoxin family protein